MTYLRTAAALGAASVLLAGCAASGAATATQRLAVGETGVPCAQGAIDEDCLPPEEPADDEPPAQLTDPLVGDESDADSGDITTQNFIVAVDGPGSFTLPVTIPYGVWTADHTDGGAYLVDFATSNDKAWADLGFSGLLAQDDPGGPIRAIIAAPYDGYIVTYVIEADPIAAGQTVEQWYDDDAPVRVLPSVSELVAGDFSAYDDDEGIALFDFTDRTVFVRVVADRETGLAWRASMTLPLSGITEQQAAEIQPLFAATLDGFLPFADTPFAG